MSKARQARRIAVQWSHLLALQPKHVQRLWNRMCTPRALMPAFPVCAHDKPNCECAGARADRVHVAMLKPYQSEFDALVVRHGKDVVFAAIGGTDE